MNRVERRRVADWAATCCNCVMSAAAHLHAEISRAQYKWIRHLRTMQGERRKPSVRMRVERQRQERSKQASEPAVASDSRFASDN